MAENFERAANARKKKLPSMDCLIRQGNDILEKRKKRRKPIHYEYSTDPKTGQRSCKNTYNPKYYNRDDTASSSRSKNLEEHSDNIFQEQEPPEVSLLDRESDMDVTTNAVEDVTMNDILEEAKGLLCNWKCGGQQKKRTWHERQNSLYESWEEVRSSLIEVLLQTKFSIGIFDELLCESCKDAMAVIGCQDCISHRYVCGDCDEENHKNHPFHDRDAILNGFHEPIPPTASINSKLEWITVERSLPFGDVICPTCLFPCNILYDEKGMGCIAVTLKGRFDISHTKYECKQCDNVISSTSPHVLIQLGFWPGTIRDMTYVFHQDLFHFWDNLQKIVPGISQNSFVKSLEMFSIQKGRMGTINSKTFGSSFREWKYCQYELNKLRHINWMECPACEQQQHSVHMDGNMKLYRYKSAGMKRDCYYGDAFIASNEKVQHHLCKIYKKGKEKVTDDSKCGDSIWHAAGNTLKKKKIVDETGLEIAGCRHSVAQHAVSMNTEKCMAMHIICKRNITFVVQHNSSGMMSSASIGLGCVIWGGRWQDGASATTGEEVEQINSHFSRLGCTTKHMLPEGREELLTEHALEWNKRKITKLSSILAKRYTKAKDKTAIMQKELESMSEKLECDPTTLQKWKEDIFDAAKLDEKSRNKRYSITPEEMKYICHLLTLDVLTPKEKALFDVAEKIYKEKSKQFQPKICRNYSFGEGVLKNKSLEYLRYNMEFHHNAISHLAFNIAKLADEPLSNIEEILNGKFPWNSRNEPVDELPLVTRRSVVDKLMEIQRFQEEIEVTKKEMFQYLEYYTKKCLPALYSELAKLENLLQGKSRSQCGGEQPVLAVESAVCVAKTYSTSSVKRTIVRGKLAL
ncbi:uncharacterized protein LOC114534881, partial [Dendronephthya gigantea]|uniref:uncharacterized protein LOC114534881 n=1 Tax=Dendronephthya gigantea TaxID=151771 RepID=UPI00106A3D7B